MSERAVLICLPVEWAGENRTKDSTDGWCELCAGPVCIAATSQPIIERGAQVVCTPCSEGLIAQLGGVLQHPTEEQFRELEAIGISRAEAMRVYDSIRKKQPRE